MKGRVYIDSTLGRLPRDTAATIHVQLTSLDQLEIQIEEISASRPRLKPSTEFRLLRTVPGIGEILARLVWLEIGEVDRFPRAENLASYAGLVPRIITSGGRIRHGGTCRNVNWYLKSGFVEAAPALFVSKPTATAMSGSSITGLRQGADTAAPSSRSPPPPRGKLLGAAQTATLQSSSATLYCDLTQFV